MNSPLAGHSASFDGFLLRGEKRTSCQRSADRRLVGERARYRGGLTDLGGEPLIQNTHAAELLIPPFQQLLHGHVPQIPQIAEQVSLQRVRHLTLVAVGRAKWFGNDVV